MTPNQSISTPASLHMCSVVHGCVQVPLITTLAGAKATVMALAGLQAEPLHQVPLQEYFPEAAEASNIEFKLND